ncbi:MAG TPA: BREX-2 system phosphatase PglZ [Polyangiaceae bacterium]
MDVPHLTREAVVEVVRQMQNRRRPLMAFYGTGEEDRFEVEGKGVVEVVPVRSELELRARMPGLEEPALRAFLVPWTGAIPDDLAGRFARNGRVESIGPSVQLRALTGAAGASAETTKLVLATYLLRRDNPTRKYGTSATELTPRTLYETWLRVDWGVPVDGELSLDTLLGWAAANGRGGHFVAAMKETAAAGLRDALVGWLEKTMNAPGVLAWRAWESEKGLELFGFALLAEALAGHQEGLVRAWLRQKLKSIVELDRDADARALTLALGQAVRPALASLRRHQVDLLPRVLDAAEALIDDPELRPFLADGTRLPTAWTLKLERLSTALLALAEEPSRDALGAVEEAWRELEKHDFFSAEEHGQFLRRTEMCVRLGRWLAVRPDRTEPPSASYADVEALGRWYAEEGGFVDWARRMARAVQSGPLAPGAEAVVAAADAAREALDARFAAALEQWIHAGRPSKNVLPIDHALERVAARFLQGDADRSLLVLLMDGMAWAQAVELLPSLGARGRRWGPIAWHSIAGNRIGSGAYPVMLAALPTVTEVSRAAFFAGKVPPNGVPLATAKDVERFENHRAMQAFSEPHVKPRLMLRGDGHTSDGALSREALHLIQSVSEQRVVGLVVNAIDASLKGDSQQEHRWDVDSIRSLPQIFDAAMAAGRHVLIAADHGHVPADRLKPAGAGHGGGARWRVWSGERDVLEPGERKFSGEGVYVPKGVEAVVLLEHDGLRYGGGAHAGEHGGAGLAEVVAPCLLLGWEDEVRARQDPALALRGLYVPDWWAGALPDATPGAVHRSEPPPPPRGKKKPSDRQMGFPDFAAVEPEPPRPPSVPPSRPALPLPGFYDSEMLKARARDAELRRQTVTAVYFLLQRSGAAPANAFAAHLNEPAFRVGGIVSKLQEVLNLDGYEVLRFDRQNQQIFLDKEKLEQQFGVEL